MQRVRSQVWTLAEIDSILEALETARPDYGAAFSVVRRAMGIPQNPQAVIVEAPRQEQPGHKRLLTSDRM